MSVTFKFLAAVLLCAVAAPFLAACGGSSGLEPTPQDEQEIRRLVDQLRTATEQGDAKSLCAMFNPERLEQWVGEKRCVQIFRVALKKPPDASGLKVKSIEVDGARATATLGVGAAGFSRVDGRWYIETPSQPGS